MSDTLVFTFGRMNPPTRGHVAHIQALKQFAEQRGFDYCVYVSKTVDTKKNPIAPEQKIQYILLAVPDVKIEVAVNMFGVLKTVVDEKKYSRVIYFAGNDYFDDPYERTMFERLTAEAQKAGLPLTVESSGDRTPGISGTALRQAVAAGDMLTFIAASPVGCGNFVEQDAINMFTHITIVNTVNHVTSISPNETARNHPKHQPQTH